MAGFMPRGWLDQDGFEGRHYCSLARLSRVVTSTRSLLPTQYPLLLFLPPSHPPPPPAQLSVCPSLEWKSFSWCHVPCAFTSSNVIVSGTFPFRTEDDWAMITTRTVIVNNKKNNDCHPPLMITTMTTVRFECHDSKSVERPRPRYPGRQRPEQTRRVETCSCTSKFEPQSLGLGPHSWC